MDEIEKQKLILTRIELLTVNETKCELFDFQSDMVNFPSKICNLLKKF